MLGLSPCSRYVELRLLLYGSLRVLCGGGIHHGEAIVVFHLCVSVLIGIRVLISISVFVGISIGVLVGIGIDILVTRLSHGWRGSVGG